MLDEASGMKAARAAYEWGRALVALRKALIATAFAAVWGLVVTQHVVLRLLPVTFAVWVFVHWRGASMLRGAWYGLLGGLVTSLLPMSLLRPCCDPAMPPGMDCCTMPGACVAAGAAVGVIAAMVVPTERKTWWQTGLGLALGMTSVAVMRCSTLVAGEALGLLGGLMLGTAAITSAKRFVPARPRA